MVVVAVYRVVGCCHFMNPQPGSPNPHWLPTTMNTDKTYFDTEVEYDLDGSGK